MIGYIFQVLGGLILVAVSLAVLVLGFTMIFNVLVSVGLIIFGLYLLAAGITAVVEAE